MEWLFAGLFALFMFIWSIAFLVRKLVRLRPLVAPFQQQLELLAKAGERVPELAKLVSALDDDPAVHISRRLELQRQARKQRRERSRRLSSRVF
jgi:hypothetical protein